jgi:hypothetical protein
MIPDLLPGRATNASTGQQAKSESQDSQQNGSDNAENSDHVPTQEEIDGLEPLSPEAEYRKVDTIDFPSKARPEAFYGIAER